MEKRNELVEKKENNDNETYTNTPIDKNKCDNRENPYVSKFTNTPNGIEETKQNMKNPFKSSSISNQSTLNSIQQSCKDSIICNLNKSKNQVNPNDSIRDSQQYKRYNNYIYMIF